MAQIILFYNMIIEMQAVLPDVQRIKASNSILKISELKIWNLTYD